MVVDETIETTELNETQEKPAQDGPNWKLPVASKPNRAARRDHARENRERQPRPVGFCAQCHQGFSGPARCQCKVKTRRQIIHEHLLEQLQQVQTT